MRASTVSSTRPSKVGPTARIRSPSRTTAPSRSNRWLWPSKAITWPARIRMRRGVLMEGLPRRRGRAGAPRGGGCPRSCRSPGRRRSGGPRPRSAGAAARRSARSPAARWSAGGLGPGGGHHVLDDAAGPPACLRAAFTCGGVVFVYAAERLPHCLPVDEQVVEAAGSELGDEAADEVVDRLVVEDAVEELALEAPRDRRSSRAALPRARRSRALAPSPATRPA